MAGETIITVVGNLTADPELRFTPSGVAVSNFVIASTPRHFDRQANEWQDGNTLFVRCSLWREAAENAVESLTKGTRVIAQGRLKARPYQSKEGENRTSWELDVDEIGPSLRFATAAVQRLPRKDRAENTGQHSQNGQGFSPSNGPGGFGAGRADQGAQEPHTGTHGQPSPANWGRASQPPPEDPWAGQPPLRTDEPPF